MSESSDIADGLSVGFDVGCVNEYKLPSSYIEIGTGILSNHNELTAIKNCSCELQS